MSLQPRLLALLAEPLTARVAAERLEVPVGRLYHHLDRLLATGRIRVVAEARRRAAIERTFQASQPAGARARLDALLVEESSVAAARLRLTPDRLRVLQTRLGELLAALESPEGIETEVFLVTRGPVSPADP